MWKKQQTIRRYQWLMALSLVSVAFCARAVPIEGTIGFVGSFTPIDTFGSATTLGTATGIDFSNDRAMVLNASGDFAPLLFSLATFTDFQFDPFGGAVPLWSAGGFTFTLTDITVQLQTATALQLEGSGIISAAGFEPAAGTWSLTGDTTNAAGNSSFSWSAGSAAVGVAEPGILALVGTGLVVLSAGRARRVRPG